MTKALLWFPKRRLWHVCEPAADISPQAVLDASAPALIRELLIELLSLEVHFGARRTTLSCLGQAMLRDALPRAGVWARPRRPGSSQVYGLDALLPASSGGSWSIVLRMSCSRMRPSYKARSSRRFIKAEEPSGLCCKKEPSWINCVGVVALSRNDEKLDRALRLAHALLCRATTRDAAALSLKALGGVLRGRAELRRSADVSRVCRSTGLGR